LNYDDDVMPFYEDINVCNNFRVTSSWASATISGSSRCVYSITGVLWLILFSSESNTREKKFRTWRWTRYGTQIRDMRNVYRILILKPQEKKSLRQYAGIPFIPVFLGQSWFYGV
jgi:hypothetical protein